MSISALRERLSSELADFCWSQWAQLGVFARAEDRHDPWAADLEALVVLTLEVGRDDPRLFDELLDWLLVNGRHLSVQRLRNLAADGPDRALAESVIEWLGGHQPRGRLRSRETEVATVTTSLFRGARAEIPRRDEAFLRHGFVRPALEPRAHSREPDLLAPIAFGLRLRQLLGIGARAEVARALLTSEAPSTDLQALAAGAGFSKRNVQEAVTALAAADVIEVVFVGQAQRCRIDHARWAALLELEHFPEHRDWPQLFLAMRRITRWLCDPARAGASDYMLASDARVLMDEVTPLLRQAGLRASHGAARGEEYWDEFEEAVAEALASLRSRPTS